MKVAKLCKNRNYSFFTLCYYGDDGNRICKRVGWHWDIEEWFKEIHGEDWINDSCRKTT